MCAASLHGGLHFTDAIRPKRALISVFDKTDILDFAKALAGHGIELLSTGGTAKLLQDEGLGVRDVASVTGFPEIMDGRVKTLHPAVHGALLGRRDKDDHVAAMEAHGIEGIDILVVNLYPFEKTIASGADFPTCVENIDIGGPAMLRAAAKNHDFLTVLTDPADYPRLLDTLETGISYEFRREMAAKTYALTAAYDSQIAAWFNRQLTDNDHEVAPAPVFVAGGPLGMSLRYGENPHQNAAFYTNPADPRPGVAAARQMQGKALSYNNLNDTDAAFELVCEFDAPSVAIIKHANPCGVASAETMAEAYRLALRCDPVSAFGGIVALNRPLDAATAEEITSIFSEVIIAPEADPDALEITAKKKNLRVLLTGGMPDPAARRQLVRTIAGGYLVQNNDFARITEADLTFVTTRKPDAREIADMLFAFRIAKHVKSNAIVYAKDLATAGIGAGQMSRLDSSRIAARKAVDAAQAAGLSGPLTEGSVVASDAFFPFADGLIAAAEAGVTAVIQPGGSVRDDEVIAAANERGLAMAFTGIRHFRH